MPVSVRSIAISLRLRAAWILDYSGKESPLQRGVRLEDRSIVRGLVLLRCSKWTNGLACSIVRCVFPDPIPHY